MSILNDPFDSSREAALVTGAGNGIGRAIAQALAGEGVRTVFADVRQDTVAAAGRCIIPARTWIKILRPDFH
jgi:NAD(P)-dependent dehydrogenase (short-subunit alcohol dehydrogenase family)